MPPMRRSPSIDLEVRRRDRVRCRQRVDALVPLELALLDDCETGLRGEAEVDDLGALADQLEARGGVARVGGADRHEADVLEAEGRADRLVQLAGLGARRDLGAHGGRVLREAERQRSPSSSTRPKPGSRCAVGKYVFGQWASPVSDGRPLAVPPIIGIPAAVIVSAIAFSAVESWTTMPTTPASISCVGGSDGTLAGALAVGGDDLDRVAVHAAHLGVDPLGPGVGDAVGHAVGERGAAGLGVDEADLDRRARGRVPALPQPWWPGPLRRLSSPGSPRRRWWPGCPRRRWWPAQPWPPPVPCPTRRRCRRRSRRRRRRMRLRPARRRRSWRSRNAIDA